MISRIEFEMELDNTFETINLKTFLPKELIAILRRLIIQVVEKKILNGEKLK